MIIEKQNLGEVKAGEVQKFSIGISKTKEIKNIHISCGCTKVQPTFIPRPEPIKVLKVSYTPGAIPQHLKERGWYKAEQKVTLTYEDNNQFRLIFNAKVVE